MKACIDCKYCVISMYSTSCRHSSNIESKREFNVVYGPQVSSSYIKTCLECRESSDSCGIYAKYFKPRSWWTLLKMAITGELHG